eukprot:SAG11_NODE_33856_length_275_cov_0.585227_1_plen_71_part_10
MQAAEVSQLSFQLLDNECPEQMSRCRTTDGCLEEVEDALVSSAEYSADGLSAVVKYQVVVSEGESCPEGYN